MELTTPNSRVPNSGSWKPGQSGNVGGKPVGARHRFSRAFGAAALSGGHLGAAALSGGHLTTSNKG
jgi:hypothetical protein